MMATSTAVDAARRRRPPASEGGRPDLGRRAAAEALAAFALVFAGCGAIAPPAGYRTAPMADRPPDGRVYASTRRATGRRRSRGSGVSPSHPEGNEFPGSYAHGLA